MKSRIVSGIVGAIILIAVVLSGVLPFRIAVGIVSALMVAELCRAASISRVFFIPSMVYAAVFAANVPNETWADVLTVSYITFILLTTLFQHEKIHISQAGLACLFGVFIGFFMGCITKIRMFENGSYWIWLIFLGAWVTDIFAYFSGMLFGKRKLMPAVSPKKTIAGSVGGLLGAALSFFVFGFFLRGTLGEINLAFLTCMGIIASAAGQLGDLVASIIKRQYGVKDYGKIMPGHGGFMDRFDSILFVAPIIYIYLMIVL